MDVLIAVASKHGSSMEIGEAIAAAIRAGGATSKTAPVGSVESLDGFDAVVLGSAVYAGHWLRSARDFVDRFEIDLKARPVWLFSSGPLGEPARPLEHPAEVAPLSVRLSTRGHRLFAGRIDVDDLGLAERAVVKLGRAPNGDFRPWAEISEWGGDIATTLLEPEPARA